MFGDMENLPQELLEGIFNYCRVYDVLNVACCSKQFHTLVKPILWRCACILLSPTEELGPHLENLKYTTCLRIIGDVDYDGNGGEDNEKIQTALTKSFDKGVLLGKLLDYCDPLRVKSLDLSRFSNLCGYSLECVLERLCHVKRLELATDGDINAERISELVNLEELVLRGSSLSADTFRDLINGHQLRNLELANCSQLTNNAVVYLSEEKDLEHLSLIFVKDSFNGVLVIEPLCSLSNLISLCLRAKVRDEDLLSLCKCLTKLTTLNLSYSHFTNEGLAEIHHLTSLTHLDLVRTVGVSTSCLPFLLSLPLRSLFISCGICASSSGRTIDGNIRRLNEIPTLRSLKLIKFGVDQGGNRMNVVLDSLCSRESWTVTLDIDPGYSLYKFTR